MQLISRSAVLVRRITSRVPKIRGVGLLLVPIARFFKGRACEEVEVSVFGRIMLLNPSDQIGNMLLFRPQWYDPLERALIAQRLQSGDYVVDVGANIGAYTLFFAGLVGPSGHVTAIEAEPRNMKTLRHNIRRNAIDWVDALEYGVSDKQESLLLHMNVEGNAGAHSFLRQVSTEDVTQVIHCKPLYELMEKVKPRLIKLDIEGFEWRVLCKFFEDAPEPLWPDYILLEDEPRHRENNAVGVACGRGYRVTSRIDNNVFLERVPP